MAKRTAIDFAGVRLTSPDKILYPEQGITKRELAEYYRAVADDMLPHVCDRPLTLVRCPDGPGSACFYQKHVGRSVPDSVGTMELQEQTKRGTYMVVRDLPGLVGLVQMNALEIHVWPSRKDALEKPDRMIFDLDPAPDVSFEDVMAAARALRQRLGAAGLESFPLVTGGKGLHVVVPLERRHLFDEVRTFARGVAKALEREEPGRYIAEASKQKRGGRIFVDWLRNTRGATAICPFSTRAREGAPVALPIAWRELRAGLAPDRHTVSTVPGRLAQRRQDPWEGWRAARQRLSAKIARELGVPAP